MYLLHCSDIHSLQNDQVHVYGYTHIRMHIHFVRLGSEGFLYSNMHTVLTIRQYNVRSTDQFRKEGCRIVACRIVSSMACTQCKNFDDFEVCAPVSWHSKSAPTRAHAQTCSAYGAWDIHRYCYILSVYAHICSTTQYLVPWGVRRPEIYQKLQL